MATSKANLSQLLASSKLGRSRYSLTAARTDSHLFSTELLSILLRSRSIRASGSISRSWRGIDLHSSLSGRRPNFGDICHDLSLRVVTFLGISVTPRSWENVLPVAADWFH